MGKVYEVFLTNTKAIYIATGSYRLITVPFAHEARIGKIVVEQVEGTSVAFTVDILESKIISVDLDIANGVTLPANWRLYKIMATQSATAGDTVEVYVPTNGSDGFLFRNADGSQTLPERYLYVLLQPTSAGTITSWEMAISGWTEIGGQ